MKLNAAHRLLAMDPRLKYDSTEGEYAMSLRWRHLENKKFISTDNPEFRLVVGKAQLDYYVFILQKGAADTPVGYVRFQVRLGLDVPEKARYKVYTPHSYLRKEFRGKGFISSIYKWFLNSSGNCLLASYRHSPDASVLWKGLLAKYPHVFLTENLGKYYVAPKDSKKKDTTALVGITKNLNPLMKALVTET
jgi:hypothetical protein